MTDDAAFIQAIRPAPDDLVARLIYADWLEERGDPRAEFLRIEVALGGLPREDARWGALRARLRELRPAIGVAWLTLLYGPRAKKLGIVQCKDIPDLEVLRLADRWDREGGFRREDNPCALDALTEKYGVYEVCARKIQQLVKKDLLTFGLSIRSAFPTRDGAAMLDAEVAPCSERH